MMNIGTVEECKCECIIFYFFFTMAKTRMTSKVASRIQSATAKATGGKVGKGSFSSRAQSAAAKGSK